VHSSRADLAAVLLGCAPGTESTTCNVRDMLPPFASGKHPNAFPFSTSCSCCWLASACRQTDRVVFVARRPSDLVLLRRRPREHQPGDRCAAHGVPARAQPARGQAARAAPGVGRRAVVPGRAHVGYDPQQRPEVDDFFASVAFRCLCWLVLPPVLLHPCAWCVPVWADTGTLR
jgi:hypothetical protein